MKIKVFKIDEYRDCQIYYRNFLFHFEYLTIIKKQLYTAHIEVKPTILNRIFYWFGIEEIYYSQQQSQKIIAYLRRLAETTIDYILNNK
jgi:hypothetical protein